MSEPTLQAVLQRELANTIGGEYGTNLTSQHSNELIQQREEAIRAFYGEPIGNEVEGRSQVIMTDVADIIEWMLPSLIEFLTAPETLCKFKPVRAAHADLMDEASQLTHHLIMNENDGYQLLFDFTHDGLLLKTGVFKVTADDEPVKTKRVARDLTDEEVEALNEAEGYEVISDEVDDDGERVVEFFEEIKKGRVEIDCMQPESFSVSRLARDLEDSRILLQAQEMTRTALKEMGFDEEVVDKLPKWRGGGFTQQIRRERFQVDTSFSAEEYDPLDPAMEEIITFEAYLPVDFDGDGIAELRKITAAGEELQILDNVEVEDHPFVTWCPFPVPHKFFGQSLADKMFDIQTIHSTVMRQGLDAIYNLNINRAVVDIEAIDPDDFLANNESGIIKKSPTSDKTPHEAVMQLQNVPIDVSPMIEHIKEIRRDRSGLDPFSQDSTSQALANSASGTAINMLQTSARKKQELVARHLANAVKQLCEKVLKLAIQHGITAEIEQEDGSFLFIDPSEWSMDMVADVEVGLGYGSRDREIAASTDLMQMQASLVQMQEGLQGPLIQPEHIVNGIERFIRASQLGKPSEFVGPAQEEPELTPDQIAEQAITEYVQSQEGQAQQFELEKLKVQLQLEMAKLQAAQMAPEIERERNAINMERELRTASIDEQKAELEAGIKQHEAGLKQSNDAGKLQIEQQKVAVGAEVDREKIAQSERDSIRDYRARMAQIGSQREAAAVSAETARETAQSKEVKKDG